MILSSTILGFTVMLYTAVRSVCPLKTNIGNKIAFVLLINLAAFKFHILYMIEGENFFTPNLPAGLVWTGSWLFCAVCAFMLLLLAADVVRLPLYLGLRFTGHKPHRRRWRKLNNRVNLALLLLALGLSAWGTWCGIKPPTVKLLTIPLPNMAADAAPIRLVQLTDLHADSTKDASFYQDIVDKVNALQPDIIVLTGDYADGHVADCRAALEPLQNLHAPMGVFAVNGNHDYFWGSKLWLSYLQEQGIQFIDGKTVTAEIPTTDGRHKRLQLTGVHDPMASRAGYEVPHLRELVSTAPATSPRILLSHNPRVADAAAGLGFDLQLSGHTHGGQFPGLKKLVARMNNGYVGGLYEIGRMKLYVSAGTSLWTPICLRLGTTSEITLINIVPAHN